MDRGRNVLVLVDDSRAEFDLKVLFDRIVPDRTKVAGLKVF